MVEGYRYDIDFAFFVNNYNYSLSEYEELTPRQKLFIMKGWEDKLISETTHMRNAVLNAVSNSMRKKGSRFTDLWKKKQKKADLDYVKESLKIIQEVQEASDNSWLDLVYASSGLHKPRKKKVEFISSKEVSKSKEDTKEVITYSKDILKFLEIEKSNTSLVHATNKKKEGV